MGQALTKFIKGFEYAFRGVVIALRERNMRVHIGAMALVLVASWYFQLSLVEWAVVIIMVGLVMAAEVINTAAESICNILRDTLHCSYDSTQDARDLAAGAVLILALTSVGVAIVIFGPKILMLLATN